MWGRSRALGFGSSREGARTRTLAPASVPGTDPATLMGLWFDDLTAANYGSVANNTSVSTWLNRGTFSGTIASATGGTSKPVKQAGGLDGNDSGYMTLPANYALSDWTVYFVGNFAGTMCTPLAGDDVSNLAAIQFSGGAIVVQKDNGTSVSAAFAPVGLACVKVTRSVSAVAARSGALTFNGTLSGTLTVRQLFGSANAGYTDLGNLIRAIGVHNSVLSAGNQTAVEDWINGQYGVRP